MSVFRMLLRQQQLELPKVTTYEASEITYNSVVLNGSVEFSRAVSVGFYYRDITQSEWTYIDLGNIVNDSFKYELSVEENTIYYYYASCIYNGNEYRGEAYSFQTEINPEINTYPEYLMDNLIYIIDGTYQLDPLLAFNQDSVFTQDYQSYQYPNAGYRGNELLSIMDGQIIRNDWDGNPNSSFIAITDVTEPYTGATGICIGGNPNDRYFPDFYGSYFPIYNRLDLDFTIYSNIKFFRYPPISEIDASGGGFCLANSDESSYNFVFAYVRRNRLMFGRVVEWGDTPMSTINIGIPILPVNIYDGNYHNVIMRRTGFMTEIIIDGHFLNPYGSQSSGFHERILLNTTGYIDGSYNQEKMKTTYGNIMIFNRSLEDEEINNLLEVDKRRFALVLNEDNN